MIKDNILSLNRNRIISRDPTHLLPFLSPGFNLPPSKSTQLIAADLAPASHMLTKVLQPWPRKFKGRPWRVYVVFVNRGTLLLQCTRAVGFSRSCTTADTWWFHIRTLDTDGTRPSRLRGGEYFTLAFLTPVEVVVFPCYPVEFTTDKLYTLYLD